MIEINFTVLVVQMITFLVAVFVLWRFFWGPFVKFLDNRKSLIQQDISKAQIAREDAEKMANEYKQSLGKIEEETRKLVDKAIAEGIKNKNDILVLAHEQAKKMMENAKAQLEEEKNKAKDELRSQAASLSIQIAEKILKQTIDKNVQERLLKEFSKEMKYE
jgi:F-type H+-transporting ATPase subunit b